MLVNPTMSEKRIVTHLCVRVCVLFCVDHSGDRSEDHCTGASIISRTSLADLTSQRSKYTCLGTHLLLHRPQVSTDTQRGNRECKEREACTPTEFGFQGAGPTLELPGNQAQSKPDASKANGRSNPCSGVLIEIDHSGA